MLQTTVPYSFVGKTPSHDSASGGIFDLHNQEKTMPASGFSGYDKAGHTAIEGSFRRKRLMREALALVGSFILVAAPAMASSHREAPAITAMPKLDGTDFYMFRSYETGRDGFVTFIANYLPLQDPNGGPNYFELDGDGFYEIHIDNNGDGVADITFRFHFSNTQEHLSVNAGGVNVPIPLVQAGQIGLGGNPGDIGNLNVRESFSLSVLRGPFAPAEFVSNASTRATTFEKPVDNIGFKTLPVYAAYAAAHLYNIQIPGCAGNGRVFVGQRKDPFVVNLGETFDLINIANPIGENNANAGRDDIADKNVTSLVLEVPISCVVTREPVIGAWTTTTAATSPAPFFPPILKQVSRLGMPLVNELVIGLPDKDAFNESQPNGDARFLTYVTHPSFPAIVELVFAGAVKAPTLFPRSDLVATFLTGIGGVNQPADVRPAEMLRLNTTTPVTPAGKQNRLGVIGGDNAGFPNGRRPGDDVVDVVLRVAMGRLISLGLFGTPAQAPFGNIDFTDGAIVNDSFFDIQFPYLKTPLAGSPGMAEPSVPLPPDAVLPGLQAVSAQ
jgi:Domain of unknown function (DUF4331)